jgi:serine O-acetyltransferase
LIKNMTDKDFINELFNTHSNKTNLPSPFMVQDFIGTLLSVLFPAYSDQAFPSKDELSSDFFKSKQQLLNALLFVESFMEEDTEKVIEAFYNELSNLYHLLLKDAEAIEAGDPAAKNRDEVIRSYPGFYAISIYRVANLLHRLKVPFIPRILTEIAHSKTGIDIHPGATIGQSFFIDHGTGVVIGETTHIGNRVKLYQGVTLGALSVNKNMAETKRHPTIEDDVVIYAGATILGGKTIIGHHSTIGGNVWLTESVQAHTTVYHKPQLNLEKSK